MGCSACSFSYLCLMHLILAVKFLYEVHGLKVCFVVYSFSRFSYIQASHIASHLSSIGYFQRHDVIQQKIPKDQDHYNMR